MRPEPFIPRAGLLAISYDPLAGRDGTSCSPDVLGVTELAIVRITAGPTALYRFMSVETPQEPFFLECAPLCSFPEPVTRALIRQDIVLALTRAGRAYVYTIVSLVGQLTCVLTYQHRFPTMPRFIDLHYSGTRIVTASPLGVVYLHILRSVPSQNILLSDAGAHLSKEKLESTAFSEGCISSVPLPAIVPGIRSLHVAGNVCYIHYKEGIVAFSLEAPPEALQFVPVNFPPKAGLGHQAMDTGNPAGSPAIVPATRQISEIFVSSDICYVILSPLHGKGLPHDLIDRTCPGASVLYCLINDQAREVVCRGRIVYKSNTLLLVLASGRLFMGGLSDQNPAVLALQQMFGITFHIGVLSSIYDTAAGQKLLQEFAIPAGDLLTGPEGQQDGQLSQWLAGLSPDALNAIITPDSLSSDVRESLQAFQAVRTMQAPQLTPISDGPEYESGGQADTGLFSSTQKEFSQAEILAVAPALGSLTACAFFYQLLLTDPLTHAPVPEEKRILPYLLCITDCTISPMALVNEETTRFTANFGGARPLLYHPFHLRTRPIPAEQAFDVRRGQPPSAAELAAIPTPGFPPHPRQAQQLSPGMTLHALCVPAPASHVSRLWDGNDPFSRQETAMGFLVSGLPFSYAIKAQTLRSTVPVEAMSDCFEFLSSGSLHFFESSFAPSFDKIPPEVSQVIDSGVLACYDLVPQQIEPEVAARCWIAPYLIVVRATQWSVLQVELNERLQIMKVDLKSNNPLAVRISSPVQFSFEANIGMYFISEAGANRVHLCFFDGERIENQEFQTFYGFIAEGIKVLCVQGTVLQYETPDRPASSELTVCYCCLYGRKDSTLCLYLTNIYTPSVTLILNTGRDSGLVSIEQQGRDILILLEDGSFYALTFDTLVRLTANLDSGSKFAFRKGEERSGPDDGAKVFATIYPIFNVSRCLLAGPKLPPDPPEVSGLAMRACHRQTSQTDTFGFNDTDIGDVMQIHALFDELSHAVASQLPNDLPEAAPHVPRPSPPPTADTLRGLAKLYSAKVALARKCWPRPGGRALILLRGRLHVLDYSAVQAALEEICVAQNQGIELICCAALRGKLKPGGEAVFLSETDPLGGSGDGADVDIGGDALGVGKGFNGFTSPVPVKPELIRAIDKVYEKNLYRLDTRNVMCLAKPLFSLGPIPGDAYVVCHMLDPQYDYRIEISVCNVDRILLSTPVRAVPAAEDEELTLTIEKDLRDSKWEKVRTFSTDTALYTYHRVCKDAAGPRETHFNLYTPQLLTTLLEQGQPKVSVSSLFALPAACSILSFKCLADYKKVFVISIPISPSASQVIPGLRSKAQDAPTSGFSCYTALKPPLSSGSGHGRASHPATQRTADRSAPHIALNPEKMKCYIGIGQTEAGEVCAAFTVLYVFGVEPRALPSDVAQTNYCIVTQNNPCAGLELHGDVACVALGPGPVLLVVDASLTLHVVQMAPPDPNDFMRVFDPQSFTLYLELSGVVNLKTRPMGGEVREVREEHLGHLGHVRRKEPEVPEIPEDPRDPGDSEDPEGSGASRTKEGDVGEGGTEGRKVQSKTDDATEKGRQHKGTRESQGTEGKGALEKAGGDDESSKGGKGGKTTGVAEAVAAEKANHGTSETVATVVSRTNTLPPSGVIGTAAATDPDPSTQHTAFYCLRAPGKAVDGFVLHREYLYILWRSEASAVTAGRATEPIRHRGRGSSHILVYRVTPNYEFVPVTCSPLIKIPQARSLCLSPYEDVFAVLSESSAGMFGTGSLSQLAHFEAEAPLVGWGFGANPREGFYICDSQGRISRLLYEGD